MRYNPFRIRYVSGQPPVQARESSGDGLRQTSETVQAAEIASSAVRDTSRALIDAQKTNAQESNIVAVQAVQASAKTTRIIVFVTVLSSVALGYITSINIEHQVLGAANNNAAQISSLTNRDHEQYLRTERTKAYLQFAYDSQDTMRELAEVEALFVDGSKPVISVYDAKMKTLNDANSRLGKDVVSVAYVSSEAVREAADNFVEVLNARFTNAWAAKFFLDGSASVVQLPTQAVADDLLVKSCELNELARVDFTGISDMQPC